MPWFATKCPILPFSKEDLLPLRIGHFSSSFKDRALQNLPSCQGTQAHLSPRCILCAPWVAAGVGSKHREHCMCLLSCSRGRSKHGAHCPCPLGCSRGTQAHLRPRCNLVHLYLHVHVSTHGTAGNPLSPWVLTNTFQVTRGHSSHKGSQGGLPVCRNTLKASLQSGAPLPLCACQPMAQ